MWGLMKHRQYVKSKEQHLREQTEAKQREASRNIGENDRKRKKKFVLFSVIAGILVIIGAFGIPAYTNRNKPGEWDSFAKCLTNQGAVVYGAMDFCKYTQHQAGMFGRSFKYLNYKEYTENQDVRTTPTWFIKGEKLEGEQSFETLAAKAGCSLQ